MRPWMMRLNYWIELRSKTEGWFVTGSYESRYETIQRQTPCFKENKLKKQEARSHGVQVNKVI